MARRILTALVVVAALAGCTSEAPSEPEQERIVPGTCVAEETRDEGNRVPDLTTIVDCTERHLYEVFAVLDLPRTTLTGTTQEERAANRDDLALPRELDDDSEERKAFEAFADPQCLTSWLQTTGYAEIEPRGKKAVDAEVLPALVGVTLGYSVLPEKEWLEGAQQVLCTARFDEPRSAPDDAMLTAGLRSAWLPLDLRPCRTYDDERTKVTVRPCTEQHVAEILFFFEADAVFSKRFIDRIRKRPTAKKFDRFDDVCTAALPILLGPDYDRKRLRGFGSTARRWTKASTPVRCDVGPTDFKKRDLPAGSLVGTGAKKVTFVEVG